MITSACARVIDTLKRLGLFKKPSFNFLSLADIELNDLTDEIIITNRSYKKKMNFKMK